MINLNDSAFDAKAGVAIFNDGKAGIVENVIASENKKKAEDKQGSPEYKLTFTDEAGATCNSSFWYVEQATAYATVEELIKKQGTILKHILHAIYGADYQLPNFQSAKEMLDGCMKLIREGAAAGHKFRMFANYGSTQSVKNYIQPRSWVPFMEAMSVPAAESRLKVSNIDAMARLDKDNVTTSSPSASSEAATVGDDW